MTDRELLELAAKAAGINRRYYEAFGEWGLIDDDPDGGFWNPLTDDGAALRLAVKLGVDIEFHTNPEVVEPWVDAFAKVGGGGGELLNPDHYAATRRAIVRAAAEIGRSME